MTAPVVPFFAQARAERDPSRVAVAASGVRIAYQDGSSRLCGTSGLWNVNLGYGDPYIADAVHRALLDASYLTLFRYGHTYADAAAEALLAGFDGRPYERVLFATSGSSGLDAMLKVVRQHWLLRGETRTTVVSLRGSYHGMTYGAFGLSGEDLGQRHYAVDQRSVRHVSAADASELDSLVARFGPTIAAIVIEPVLGSGAFVVSDELLASAQAARDAHGILLVADEVATGFGRTGALFASEGWTARPDLLVLSKALTNGTCAASALLWGSRVVEAFDDTDAMLVHGETQAGSPPSCAAITATLQRFGQLEGAARARVLSGAMDQGLHDRFAGLDCVAEIRGAGLFRAVALRHPDGSDWSADEVRTVLRLAYEAGAVLQPGPSCVQLVPALVYSQAELDELLDITRQSLLAAVRVPALAAR